MLLRMTRIRPSVLRWSSLRSFSDKPFVLADEIVPPPTGIKFPQIVDRSTLSEEERKKLEESSNIVKKYTAKELEEIANTTSKLYTPHNPMEEPSKADLIQQRIASIQKRLEAQKRREEANLKAMEEKQRELLKPQLSDFKRPISAFLLLAFATYMALQLTWFSLEGEENVLEKERKTREYEETIQGLLDEQREIINRKEEKGKSWWNIF